MKSQHGNRHLALMQHTEDRPRLRAAFLGMTKYLKKDPHPSLWRNRRRSSNALAVPGIDAVEASIIMLRRAIATRDQAAIEGSGQVAEAFFDELKAEGMKPYYDYANGAMSANTEGLTAHKELNEAAHALTEAMVTKCPTRIERAIKEVGDVFRPLGRWMVAARQDTTTVRAWR
jgi:hypothetical protein